MAAVALQCCPLLSLPSATVSRSFSARTPAVSRTGEARGRRLQRCRCSQSAEGRSPGSSPPQLERLFSNVNQATMKHEPGNHAQIMQSVALPIFLPLFFFFAFGVHLMGLCLCFSLGCAREYHRFRLPCGRHNGKLKCKIASSFLPPLM